MIDTWNGEVLIIKNSNDFSMDENRIIQIYLLEYDKARDNSLENFCEFVSLILNFQSECNSR